jgi:hypothetical protein
MGVALRPAFASYGVLVWVFLFRLRDCVLSFRVEDLLFSWGCVSRRKWVYKIGIQHQSYSTIAGDIQ